MTEPSAPPSTFGAILQSPALAEATVDSLGELFSRDPEGYTRQDLDKIVASLRQQRERLAAVQAEAGPKKPRVAAGSGVSLKSTVAVGDLDL